MLRYAVVLFFHERLDRKWELLCDVVKKDFEGIQEAEKYRSEYLSEFPSINVQNLQVVQYSTVS